MAQAKGQPSRLPRTERRVRHHEVDIERHAHPGEPRRVPVVEHDTSQPEPLPNFGNEAAPGERRERRDRY